MPDLYTLSDDELDNDINEHYRWFAEKAPGVTAQEQGRLKALWAEFDRRQLV